MMHNKIDRRTDLDESVVQFVYLNDMLALSLWIKDFAEDYCPPLTL